MPEPVRSLRDVLAAGLKEARQRQGLRQEDAAARVQGVGLASWIRGTVAQAEVGARKFSIEEVLLLALAYETSLAGLIAGNDADVVELTPDVRLPVGTVRALLSGQSPGELPTVSRNSGEATGTGRFPCPLAGANRFGIGERGLLARSAGATSEADRHAARKLGVAPDVVAETAQRLWGRSLSEERDYRLVDTSPDLSARRKQALRGHVTRQLLTELERELGGHDDS
jgi:transcriptional regulator with XRE-family HTH domain